MLHELWTDCAAWWAGVAPEFAFLLLLPFGVAAVGLLAEWLRHRFTAATAGRWNR